MRELLFVVHGGPVVNVHRSVATVVLVYSFLLGLWGLWLWIRGLNPSGGYLGALILDEGVAAVQVIIGIVLLVGGHVPADRLHFLYGVVSVVTLPAAYFYSSGGRERRDSLVFGIACLFLGGIAIRAITTG